MSGPDKRVNLDGLLHEIAASAPAGPKPGLIELRLRAACRARRRKRWQRWWISGAGLAACLLLAFGWEGHLSQRAAASAETSYTGFLALPYAQSDVPIEQAVVVRVSLRPADLEALGLPPALLVGRQRMPAELLIGQDGMARAVRLGK